MRTIRMMASSLALVLLVAASAITGSAEVKLIQMKIAGYLCGN